MRGEGFLEDVGSIGKEPMQVGHIFGDPFEHRCGFVVDQLSEPLNELAADCGLV